MIYVGRVGFTGMGPDDYDGPELALQDLLRHMEDVNGCAIVSVSVLR
jgi:hypothetical protein